jgi:uncharacterized protein (TIGR02118 family)
MPKRITYLEARADKSRETFRAHWATTHADIARRLPGVTAYRQNHVLETVLEPGYGGRYRVDGIVELWFADDDVVQVGFDSDVADKLIVDELNFLSGLTGGPVRAEAPHAPWPFKVWVLARWAEGAESAPDAVELWAKQLSTTYDGALGWGVNVLVPGAELLVREALCREEHLPEVTVSLGFVDEASARRAANSVGESLDTVSDVLTRVQGCFAEEIVIV